MKLKLFLNAIAYIFLFFVSVVILKQFDSTFIKICIVLFFLTLSIFISLKYFPVTIKDLYTIDQKNLFYVLIAFIIPIICFGSIALFNHLSGKLNSISFDKTNLFGNIISNIYIAITEELFARGLIFYSILKLKKNYYLALIISALVFSLFHSFGFSLVNDYPLYFIYIIISVILANIMVLSQSIIPCFVFHFTNNLISKVIDFDFGIYEKDLTPSSAITFFPFITPLILSAIYLIWKQNKTKTQPN